MTRPRPITLFFSLSKRTIRRIYAVQGVAMGLGESDSNPTALLMVALRWEEQRLRKICAERGLNYDQLARENIPHLGPVKRGAKLREVLGVTGDPLPNKQHDTAEWAGRDAGDHFAPDVDDIDPREFDSE